MVEFSFDTSGFVAIPTKSKLLQRHTYWPDLSPFVQGYVEALASSSSALKTEWLLHMPSGENRVLGFSDLDPSALALILRDCEKAASAFEAHAGGGAAFWLERQRGDYPLSFPPLQPYLSDEGRVCLGGVA